MAKLLTSEEIAEMRAGVEAGYLRYLDHLPWRDVERVMATLEEYLSLKEQEGAMTRPVLMSGVGESFLPLVKSEKEDGEMCWACASLLQPGDRYRRIEGKGQAIPLYFHVACWDSVPGGSQPSIQMWGEEE